MFEISKSFDFCYGHRVFSQKCNAKYALSSDNPCRKIHGHQGKVDVFMNSDSLDDRGFVIDFKELTFMKHFIDSRLDHRFIVSVKDPKFAKLVGTDFDELKKSNRVTEVFLLNQEVSMGYVITDPVDEDEDSFFIVNFNPTSEELAKWIFQGVQKLIDQSPFSCVVDRVRWSETPKTQATFGKRSKNE